MKRAAIERPVLFQRPEIYFDVPEELPEPMPVEPLVLPAPDDPLPSVPLLGEVLEPVLGEALEPLDEEPLAAPCSRRQRSFSAPVRVAHCVPLPSAGEVVEEEPVALGEEPVEPVEPLVEEPVLPDPPTLCDVDWAMAAAENANSAATVAAERTFSICFSYVEGFNAVRCCREIRGPSRWMRQRLSPCRCFPAPNAARILSCRALLSCSAPSLRRVAIRTAACRLVSERQRAAAAFSARPRPGRCGFRCQDLARS
jgi:hypothetical protein